MQIKSNNIWNRFHGWVGEKIAAKPDFYYANERNRDTLTVSIGTGVAAGAALGMAAGAYETITNQKTEGVVPQDIVHPEFTGHSYRTSEDTSQICYSMGEDQPDMCIESTDGWYHRYSAQYTERVVGTYDKPAFFDSNSWKPHTGALVGAAAGGLLGLGVGLGTNLVRKMSNGEAGRVTISPEKRQELESKAARNVSAGVLIGTGAGLLAGGALGLLESNRGQTVTREWMVPTTERQLMGHIPANSYQSTSGSAADRSGAAATEPVHRDVPVYGANGEIVMEKTEDTFETARFGPISGAVFGGLLGAGAGLATGVAVSVFQKMAAYEG